MKNNSTKTFENFEVKIWHSSFIAKLLSQYSICRRKLKLHEERLHQRSYSSSQIHKTMFRYHNKDIKMLVAFLPALKMVLSVEINSDITGAAARSCSLKKGIVKHFKKFVRNYLCWSLCFEKNEWKGKKDSSTVAFLWILWIFFRTLLLKVANGWLLLRALSRVTNQNVVNCQGKHLCRSSVKVKPFRTNFAYQLEICLLIMILWTFDSGLF